MVLHSPWRVRKTLWYPKSLLILQRLRANCSEKCLPLILRDIPLITGTSFLVDPTPPRGGRLLETVFSILPPPTGNCNMPKSKKVCHATNLESASLSALGSIKASRLSSGLCADLKPYFMCFFSRKTTQVINSAGSTNPRAVG